MEVVWISEKQQRANKDSLQNMPSVGDNQDGKNNKSFQSPEKAPSQRPHLESENVNVSPSTSFAQHTSGSSAVTSASGAVPKQMPSWVRAADQLQQGAIKDILREFW